MSLQDLSLDGGAIGEEGGAERGGGKEEEGTQKAYIKGAGEFDNTKMFEKLYVQSDGLKVMSRFYSFT